MTDDIEDFNRARQDAEPALEMVQMLQPYLDMLKQGLRAIHDAPSVPAPPQCDIIGWDEKGNKVKVSITPPNIAAIARDDRKKWADKATSDALRVAAAIVEKRLADGAQPSDVVADLHRLAATIGE